LSTETAWRLRSVERQSTTDQVLREIRAAIIAGRIRPHERLPEALLAETFGTGRSAVREALRQLVQEGLVVYEPHRGARVRAVALEDVMDIYLAREAIEVAAVAHALELSNPPDLSGLHGCQARIVHAAPPAAAPAPPSTELIAADLDFHRTMVALAGSPRLSRAHEALAAESQMMLSWHPVYPGTEYAADHQQILDAIESRDASVLEVVREHLRLSARLIVEESLRYAARATAAKELAQRPNTTDGGASRD
jgi:DNA-binding GntR family transcriptional regulator